MEDEYEPAGAKISIHGFQYQVCLNGLFLLRGVANKYKFKQATEMKEAGKFNDLIFILQSNGKFIKSFVQVKHRLKPEKRKITLSQLLSNEGDYSLSMYFKSFCKIKQNTKLFGENDVVGDFIIYTNADFDQESGYEGEKNEHMNRTVKLKDIIKPRQDRQNEDVIHGILQTKLFCFSQNSKHPKFVPYFLRGLKLADTTDINLFLEKFAFAVGQPSLNALHKKAQDEICMVNEEDTPWYKEFYYWVDEWFSNPKGLYMKSEEVEEHLELIRQKHLSMNFRLCDPVKGFTNRNTQLTKLYELMHGQSTDNNLVVISGIGGIGKTELARQYLKSNSKSYHCIIWLNAGSREKLKSSFYELASDKLDLKTETKNNDKKDIETILENVYVHLSKRKCIFVFADVERFDEDCYVKEFLPQVSPKPKVLIISKYKSWGGIPVIEVETFSETDSTGLIKNSLKNRDENIKLEDLVKKFQNFPLALQQIVAYINKQIADAERHGEECIINNCITFCCVEKYTLLSYYESDFGFDRYSVTTLEVWEDMLDKIQSHDTMAYSILKVIAYFETDNILIEDIAKSLKKDGVESIRDSLNFLCNYSMISIVKSRVVHILELLQLVIKKKLEKDARLAVESNSEVDN